jgi:hypothetical protein
MVLFCGAISLTLRFKTHHIAEKSRELSQFAAPLLRALFQNLFREVVADLRVVTKHLVVRES